MTAPSSVRLFVKPYCGWCQEVLEWLQQHGIAHQTLDVTGNEEHRREMTRLSGQNLAPVIDVDGQVLADFGADELEAWWKERGFPMPGS